MTPEEDTKNPEPIRSIDVESREEFQRWLDDELDDMEEEEVIQ